MQKNYTTMKAYRIIISMILLLVSPFIYGQGSDDIDPYYNGHLIKKYNPSQIDFSEEYLQLRMKLFANDTNKLEQTSKYDFSSIWLSGDFEQNGVIGSNYHRIQFHIEHIIKNEKEPYSYLVWGKSKVNNNICDFKGEIKLLAVFLFETCDYSEYKNCGELFANYIFYEDSSQNHCGVFKGVTECSIYLDKATKTMKVDESLSFADGYWNRSFVGTWTDYKSNKSKKCIWGDYRLPFTFDFDCGDGEMQVCHRYKNNGWQTFGDGSEYISSGNDKFEIKNKWWLTNKK
ncbi:MAG: hypothetical protein K9J13_00125 [Saprospiraceae bacterium]|nr:hypothetical protein [Saprospiraceae bacterium]